MAVSQKQDKNFKGYITELEEINEWFASNDLDLDTGLEKLKKGKEIINICREKLKSAETEFNKITADIVIDESASSGTMSKEIPIEDDVSF